MEDGPVHHCLVIKSLQQMTSSIHGPQYIDTELNIVELNDYHGLNLSWEGE